MAEPYCAPVAGEVTSFAVERVEAAVGRARVQG